MVSGSSAPGCVASRETDGHCSCHTRIAARRKAKYHHAQAITALQAYWAAVSRRADAYSLRCVCGLQRRSRRLTSRRGRQCLCGRGSTPRALRCRALPGCKLSARRSAVARLRFYASACCCPAARALPVVRGGHACLCSLPQRHAGEGCKLLRPAPMAAPTAASSGAFCLLAIRSATRPARRWCSTQTGSTQSVLRADRCARSPKMHRTHALTRLFRRTACQTVEHSGRQAARVRGAQRGRRDRSFGGRPLQHGGVCRGRHRHDPRTVTLRARVCLRAPRRRGPNATRGPAESQTWWSR
jgi:hypothetical protein